MKSTAWAPGRVNLIGDHTDTTGGLVLPMAIDLGTTITGTSGGSHVMLRSGGHNQTIRIPIGLTDPTSISGWGRYIAGVVSQLRPQLGFKGQVTTTLPVGAGLSSSAALAVAAALVLGAELPPLELAELCQRAEQAASGVPCGIMDQLASVAGVDGHALLIDCTALSVVPVPIPPDLEVVVVHSGVARGLAGSAYGQRRLECEAAENDIGPLRLASIGDERQVHDPIQQRRARHVISENARVRSFAAALGAGRYGELGEIMAAGHASLRDDFEVSTPVVDQLVQRLCDTPGVHGARMTGGGFGGCVVALTEPDALHGEGWTVSASGGARLL